MDEGIAKSVTHFATTAFALFTAAVFGMLAIKMGTSVGTGLLVAAALANLIGYVEGVMYY